MPHFTHLMAGDILVPKYHTLYGDCWGLEDEDNVSKWVTFCPDYPHLFRPLKWWEGLAIDELPKYVKWQGEDRIWMCRVNAWSIEDAGTYFYGQMVGSDENIKLLASDSDIPATEAEYQDYLTKLNK
jgi:hypothetical protein